MKHFAIVSVMVFMALLVAGNWAMPVSANTADIITSTPTGTPVTSPNDQSETVSDEQQQELKAAIQNYFEVRYHVFSTLQLDEFENLISGGTDNGSFVMSETGKLKIGIRNAELNGLRYVDYKFYLEFDQITIDPQSQIATVSVVEGNEVVYEISQELNPEKPTVSRMYNLKHTINMKKVQDQWKIISDDYTDYLWRMLRQKKISTDELLSSLKASPKPGLQAANLETAVPLTLPDDASVHPYDREGAKQYALDHIHNYNLDYPVYTGLGGDCTNFVSQALYEGGNISMYIPSPLPGPSPDGQSGWYLLNDLQRATDWNLVGGFYDFVTDRSEAITEGPEGSEVAINLLMKGDVIQYDWSGDGTWDHAVIVVDIINGIPYVASHTDDVGPEPYTYFIPWGNIRFIHIERSDGNPPIRIEIASASDDAGGNPTGNPCPKTNYDSGNNYFGGCTPSGQQGITSGFLFRNVQIPKGAQIKYAYVNFTTDGTYTVRTEDSGVYAPISLQIAGENTVTPANFSSTNTPADRQNLTASIPWPINRTDTSENISYDTWHWKSQRTTPSITPIIQSIIGLPSWSSGNTISLIFQNGISGSTYARRVIAYEATTAVGANYSPARLIAAYDMATNSLSYNSLAAQDGWILESSETSGKGGTTNSGSTTLIVGDDPADKQYRSILHFDTSSLPDNAVITYATLKIKLQSVTGTDQFTTLGNLIVDIKKPAFGTNANLAKSDFEDTTGVSSAAIFDPAPSVDNWFTAILSNASFSYINLTGATQFRLSFTTDDNDDLDPDYFSLFSGNDATATNRPQLTIYYFVPSP